MLDSKEILKHSHLLSSFSLKMVNSVGCPHENQDTTKNLEEQEPSRKWI